MNDELSLTLLERSTQSICLADPDCVLFARAGFRCRDPRMAKACPDFDLFCQAAASAAAAPVNTYDTAATVAYVLGLKPPACWIGKPVREAFE